MKTMLLCVSVSASLLLMLVLSACGFAGKQLAEKANEERLLKPGALDLSLTGVYDTYQYKFLDSYRVTHQWPRISNCSYRKQPTLGIKDGSTGEFFAVRDIYESDGKTWQRFEGEKPYDFSRYVRSVKIMNPVVYDKMTGQRIPGASEEIEAGLQAMCHQS